MSKKIDMIIILAFAISISISACGKKVDLSENISEVNSENSVEETNIIENNKNEAKEDNLEVDLEETVSVSLRTITNWPKEDNIRATVIDNYNKYRSSRVCMFDMLDVLKEAYGYSGNEYGEIIFQSGGGTVNGEDAYMTFDNDGCLLISEFESNGSFAELYLRIDDGIVPNKMTVIPSDGETVEYDLYEQIGDRNNYDWERTGVFWKYEEGSNMPPLIKLTVYETGYLYDEEGICFYNEKLIDAIRNSTSITFIVSDGVDEKNYSISDERLTGFKELLNMCDDSNKALFLN